MRGLGGAGCGSVGVESVDMESVGLGICTRTWAVAGASSWRGVCKTVHVDSVGAESVE